MKLYRAIPAFLQRLIWLPTRLMFRVFGKLEIKGKENIRLTGNAIFASNHISELDPILIASCMPFWSPHLPMFYASREKNFYKGMKGWKKILYGGAFFKAWGAYRVYVGLKNYEASLKHQTDLLKKGNNLSIFPEAKRSHVSGSVKTKGGVAFLGHRSGRPIIPVLIKGCEKITVSDFFLRKRKIVLIFGKPLYSKDIFSDPDNVILDEGNDDYEKAASTVMESVYRLDQ